MPHQKKKASQGDSPIPQDLFSLSVLFHTLEELFVAVRVDAERHLALMQATTG
jgi:hypothetical protein